MQHSEIPLFSDLKALASSLATRPEYKKIGRLIEKTMLSQSCLSDLMQAQDCCAALRHLINSPRKQGTRERAATEMSLLHTAIILYDRSTAAAGKRGERGAISIVHHLDENQLTDHKYLVQLRNRAAAHVYAGEMIGDEIWHRHELFAIQNTDGWKPAAASNRMHYNKSTLIRLESQILAAIKILTTKFNQRMDRLTKEFNDNPGLEPVFRQHIFDAVEKFGSIDAVRRVLVGQGTGSAVLLQASQTK